jgi:hypothetical protein
LTRFQVKRVGRLAARLALAPPALAARIETLLSAPPAAAFDALHALEGEVLDLVAAARPEIDLSPALARLPRVRWLGRPVLEGFLWLVERLRRRAYADVEGRYYQFSGNPIDIVEEADGARWLALAQVRRTVDGLPPFASLQRLDAGGVRRGDDGRERIEARTLVQVLAKAQALPTRRFVVWLEREVIFPAQRKARRGG